MNQAMLADVESNFELELAGIGSGSSIRIIVKTLECCISIQKSERFPVDLVWPLIHKKHE